MTKKEEARSAESSWTQRDGTTIAVRDMSDGHLAAAIAMCLRNHRKRVRRRAISIAHPDRPEPDIFNHRIYIGKNGAARFARSGRVGDSMTFNPRVLALLIEESEMTSTENLNRYKKLKESNPPPESDVAFLIFMYEEIRKKYIRIEGEASRLKYPDTTGQ
jgi:hypothetical protein